jgi:hypothetical protein
MQNSGPDGCYGDFWMLVGISEAYSAKIILITSENGSRYCAVLTPNEIKYTIVLRAHCNQLYFDAVFIKTGKSGR